MMSKPLANIFDECVVDDAGVGGEASCRNAGVVDAEV